MTLLLYFIGTLAALAILLMLIAISYICWCAFFAWLLARPEEGA
jgi:hypothetical protein